jgi:hypothetical protein
MWSKFVFIAALSGVGALTRAPIGVIRSPHRGAGASDDLCRHSILEWRARGELEFHDVALLRPGCSS